MYLKWIKQRLSPLTYKNRTMLTWFYKMLITFEVTKV